MLLSFPVKVKLRGLAAWDSLPQSTSPGQLVSVSPLTSWEEIVALCPMICCKELVYLSPIIYWKEGVCLTQLICWKKTDSLSPATSQKELVHICPMIYWKEPVSVQWSVQKSLVCLSPVIQTSSIQQTSHSKSPPPLFGLIMVTESVVFITKLYKGKCPNQN